MRLKKQIAVFLKELIQKWIPGARIYLFGSRIDNNAKGGDIDLMIITNEKIDQSVFRKIRIEFYKRFGWQKIDMVNFTDSEQSYFKTLISQNCIQL